MMNRPFFIVGLACANGEEGEYALSTQFLK